MARGRSFCSDVSSQDCAAPAGLRGGMGYASLPGVKRSELHTCGYCGEPVCSACSGEMEPPAFFKSQRPVRVCLGHNEDELADWLGIS